MRGSILWWYVSFSHSLKNSSKMNNLSHSSSTVIRLVVWWLSSAILNFSSHNILHCLREILTNIAGLNSSFFVTEPREILCLSFAFHVITEVVRVENACWCAWMLWAWWMATSNIAKFFGWRKSTLCLHRCLMKHVLFNSFTSKNNQSKTLFVLLFPLRKETLEKTDSKLSYFSAVPQWHWLAFRHLVTLLWMLRSFRSLPATHFLHRYHLPHDYKTIILRFMASTPAAAAAFVPAPVAVEPSSTQPSQSQGNQSQTGPDPNSKKGGERSPPHASVRWLSIHLGCSEESCQTSRVCC